MADRPIDQRLDGSAPLTPNWRAVRRFLDARAERAAGRAIAKRPGGLARPASEASATNENGRSLLSREARQQLL
jgi:hypothetical protein